MDTQPLPARGRDDGTQQDMPDLQRSRLERAPGLVLPASGIIWTAGELLHVTGGHAMDAGIGTVVAGAVAYGLSARERIPSWTAWATAGTGGWLTAAACFGPLHWEPWMPLTTGAAVAAFWCRRLARRHPAVIERRGHREARAEWLSGQSRRWHMGGSHLLHRGPTRLGELYKIDVTGTGKLASELPLRRLPEQIAQERRLPSIDRVKAWSPQPGQVWVSIRDQDPWEYPALHPLLDDDPEIDLSGRYSITEPAVIGIDPETGNPMLLPLLDEIGAKNVSIVSIRGGGKTVLMHDISERVTAAYDAMMVRINLSIKGPGEAHRWGPACHLSAFGPGQTGRAVRILRTLHKTMEYRSGKYATADYRPSREDPAIAVFLDEVDAAMKIRGVKGLVEDIATKGREYGIILIHAGQRGTSDYTSPKTRSQVDVGILGRVRGDGEAYHALASLARNLPDMTRYGHGAPGVWGIALPDAAILGRAFLMASADAARIARERAFTQPVLSGECAEYLGDDYRELLATDLFAEWAREQGHGTPRTPAPSGEAPEAGTVLVQAPPETSHAADLTAWDAEMHQDMDPDTAENLGRLRASTGEKLRDASQRLADTANRPRPPEISQEAMAEHTRQRWQQVDIPDGVREKLLGLLADGGMSSRKIEEALNGTWKKSTIATWLGKLRSEGLVELTGQGPASRWRLTDGDHEA